MVANVALSYNAAKTLITFSKIVGFKENFLLLESLDSVVLRQIIILVILECKNFMLKCLI